MGPGWTAPRAKEAVDGPVVPHVGPAEGDVTVVLGTEGLGTGSAHGGAPHATSPAPAVVGIVGAGQLARMMVQAGVPLGIRMRVLAREHDDPAARIAPEVEVGRFDAADLDAFTRTSADQLTTFDHEAVDPEALASLEAQGRVVRPGASTLRVVLDKAAQRVALRSAGWAVPPSAVVTDVAGAEEAVRIFGTPAVLKAATGGFDGRGVRFVTRLDEVADAVGALPGRVLVEPMLAVDAELSVLVVRRPSGDAVTYPVIRTHQVGGTCRLATAPSGLHPDIERQAQELALAVAHHVQVVGVLAVELFLVGGVLVINELAARPHNSGHLTLEACATSQFENHLRAVLDWPLGATDLVVPTATMANVLAVDGTSDPHRRVPEVLHDRHVHVHLYDKRPRPGRKVGHVTVTGDDPAGVTALALRAANHLAAPHDAGGAP